MLDARQNVFIAGARGMVGSAVERALRQRGFERLLTPGRQDLDLTSQAAVRRFYAEEKPDTVIVAAARVGGIHANQSRPAEFLYQNLAIAQNTIHAAYENQVRQLLFLGSSCIYPREAPQPMSEDCLLTGPLEPTNEAYAIAKIAGLKLCQYYRRQYGCRFFSLMPTNLYGPGDNYHPENSHVLPALIRRFHEAGKNDPVTLWGSGRPRREFLHVDDLAEAVVHVLGLEDPPDWMNAGCGEDVSIRDLAVMIQEVAGHCGELRWDDSKPDGTPRKLLDVSRLFATGWRPRIGLREGLGAAFQNYLNEKTAGTLREV